MDAASIEQMNKVRKGLGLPLLPVPGAAPSTSGPTFKDHVSDASDDEEPASTLDTREAAADGNWQKLQDEQEAKKRREAKVAALKKARDASQRFSRLEGKGLGDLGKDGELNAKSWLKSQNKRQKKIDTERVARLARELEERERLASIDYKSSDLAGVRVAHEIEDFGEAEGEQILTLKDKAIGDEDDEDELEARELVEKDVLTKKMDQKKKKPAYDIHADTTEGDRNLLSQYDEDTNAKKKFTLDGTGNSVEAREAKKIAVSDLLKSSKSIISLKVPNAEDIPTSDYLAEIKIRKPKKDKKRKREKVLDDEDDFALVPHAESAMDIDSGARISSTIRNANTNIIEDDEDLQSALAQSRRAALKKRKRLRPEDLARQLRAESEDRPKPDSDNEDGLVFDETTNFVENLQVHRPEAEARPIRPKTEIPPTESHSPADEEDVEMEESYNALSDAQDRIKHESPQPTTEGDSRGLDEEDTLDQGLGSTLHLLRQRGLVKDQNGAVLSAQQRAQQQFLAEKRRREADSEVAARNQRELDRKGGRFDRMSAQDRQDYARNENTRRELADQRAMAELFNAHYKPNVELKYVDEQGRRLDQKEAFKALSHQFHGKGSGKLKTEKHIKKIEDEKKREATSALDASQAAGMHNAMGGQAKKNKQAGVRLM